MRTPEHEFVVSHTKGRKCLILGGHPSDRITKDLGDSLEFSEVFWPECPRSASFDKVKPLIPRFDFMVLKVMNLTHRKTPLCRDWAKQHGVVTINNDSDGISRTVQNFFSHLSGPALDKPPTPAPAPPSTEEWAAKILARIQKADRALVRGELTGAYKNTLPAQRVLDILASLEQDGKICKTVTAAHRGRPTETWAIASAVELEPPAIEAAPVEIAEPVTETASAEPSLNLDELKRVRAHMLSQKEPRDAELATLSREEGSIQARLLEIKCRREVIDADTRGMTERIYAIDQLLMVFGE